MGSSSRLLQEVDWPVAVVVVAAVVVELVVDRKILVEGKIQE